MTEIVNRETGEVFDADSVPGLAAVAAFLDQEIGRLSARVDDLLDGLDVGEPSRGPIVWDQLTPAEAEHTWRALAEWVGWLRSRYPLAQRLPRCWWRHSEIVEELTALWLAWRDAYVAKGAPLSGGADWHARWLPEFLRRIGAGGWNLPCESEHRPVVSGLYDRVAVDDIEHFEAYITAVEPRHSQGQETQRMEDHTMQEALDAGRARRIGGLTDSPVAYDGEYWSFDGDCWVQVIAPETVRFLMEAERRMTLADAAVERSQET